MSKLYRFLISLLLLTLTSLSLKAEVFIVTSNADAGAGTLREALAKAAGNGSAQKDFIHFNISQNEPKIAIGSSLILSSNLVIDATTQTSNYLGSSTTKVTLLTTVPYTDNASVTGFQGTSIRDVEIYGFYFLQFVNYARYASPIYIISSENIIVGAPGKGNVFLNADIQMYFSRVKKVKISSNWFGFNPERNTVGGTAFGMSHRILMCDDVTIGGDTREEGNEYGGYCYYGMSISGVDPTTQTVAHIGNICVIKNNKFKEDIVTPVVSIGTNIIRDFKRIELVDNYYVLRTAFNFRNISEGGIVQGNKFGISLVNPNLQNQGGVSMIFENCYNMKIGGYLPNQPNIFSNGGGIYADGCGDFLLTQNSIYCNSYGLIYTSQNSKVVIPKVEILSYANGLVSGSATPNSLVEVFLDGECARCEAKTFFTSVQVGADGFWSTTVPINSGFTASASLNNRTSTFVGLSVVQSNVKVKNASCGEANGGVTGIKVSNFTKLEWRNAQNEIVSTELDLKNVTPGIYGFTALMGDACRTPVAYFEVKEATPILNSRFVTIVPQTCGQQNGAIRNLSFINSSSFIISSLLWLNENQVEVGNSLNLIGVGEGSYHLKITTIDGCVKIFGPFDVPSQGLPKINEAAVIIRNSTCNLNDGAIENIIMSSSGNYTYSWKNDNGQIINTSSVLRNVVAGKYYLTVKDQSGCESKVYDFTILESNGITISDTQKQIFNPTCVGNNGSVKGLQTTGATSYTWKNSNGQTVGTQANLEGMPPGDYQLTASNPFCSKTYDVTLTAQPNLISFQGTTKTITDASCGLNNGKLIVTLQNVIRLPKSYRWEDKEGRTVGGNTNVLENVDAGEYSIYGKDDNDCEIFLATYTINRQSVLSFSSSNYRVVHDNCNQRQGSISGLQISGGLAPYTYKWTNEAGNQVGSTLNISNLPAGNYTLQITDALNCTPLLSSYAINNQTQQVAAPTVTPIQLCAPGQATLRVSGAAAATSFALYANQQAMSPLDISMNGVFKIDAGADKNYFVAQRVGECESERVEVKITVGLSGLTVANTITPNNDGINDTWNLRGIENYPQAQIQIFNRAGVKVYETIGYKTPFDGTNKGEVLPVGVYYYIIKLGAACELVRGTLTIIR